MSRIWGALVLAGAALVLFSLSPSQTIAQNVNNFEVASFDAQYHLSRNDLKTSLLDVTETIVVRFPNFDQNHGILRAIPESYRDHTVSLNIESVKNAQGQNWNYTTYSENDNLVLKIGDADKYVRGETTYVIKYSLRNVTSNFGDHDEFYWDINGDEWPVPFETVTARLSLSEDVAAALDGQMACYGGERGESDQSSCNIARRGDIITTSAAGLNAYETLTMAVGFQAATFVPGPEIAQEQRDRLIKYGAMAALIILPPIAAFAFMYRRWRAFGDDPKGRGVIVPEYEPPKKLNTLSSDFLLQQKLRSQAFSAGIVELAIAGFVNIHEIPKKGLFGKPDYELELVKPVDSLGEEHKSVVHAIFGAAEPGASVKISHIKRSSSLRSDIAEAMNKLEEHLADDLNKKGYFIKNPKKIKRGYMIWATVAFAFGIGLVFVPYIFVLGISLLLVSAVIFFFAFYMPARTLDGVNAHDALLGLRDYIKLAESERLNFGQSPEGAEKIKSGSFDPDNPKNKVKLFESLLPYAMLFGLEKEWSKQFEGIYKQPPNWYSGHSGAFNAAYLGSSLSGFSSSNQTTFSAPSSSGSSGFSGGSSGGGGGGGGGGGW